MTGNNDDLLKISIYRRREESRQGGIEKRFFQDSADHGYEIGERKVVEVFRADWRNVEGHDGPCHGCDICTDRFLVQDLPEEI